MYSYSAEKIFRNIRALAKLQGRGMNELEISVGTSPGYCLGRMKRAENKSYDDRRGRDKASLEIIWRFSKELGVSINDLIEQDFEKILEGCKK